MTVSIARTLSVSTSLIATPSRRAAEALAYATGTASKGFLVHKPVDVGALRKRFGLNQSEFAARFGLSVGTLRDWEQGRSVPDRPAQVLLRVIEREPDAVQRALEDV